MRRQRGFSLAEVLVALLILTIVITTSLATFVERKKRLKQAYETILAYQALSNEAEMQRRFLYDKLVSGGFQSDTQILAPLQPFATIVFVEQTQPGIKRVTMTVRWQNGKKDAKLVLVRTDSGGTNLW
jgi:prepilin-type N-terminal cleavage/methylation domain-containing protein